MSDRKPFLACSTAVIACALTVCSASGLAQDRYSVTDLGVLPGDNYSRATGINSSGQVVGLSFFNYGDFSSKAFVWTPGSGMRNLAAEPGLSAFSYASGINDSGQVVGWNNGGFVWSPSSGTQFTAPTYPGWNVQNNAFAINNKGQVTGFGLFPSGGGAHAALWSGNTVSDLGALSPPNNGQMSSGYAVNESGLIVGDTSTQSSSSHAFVWDSVNGMRDIGTLFARGSSNARGVNDLGQVVGWSNELGTMNQHIFVWSAATGMVDLGRRSEDPYAETYAYDINNLGQIVGYERWTGGGTAFIWTKESGMQTLDLLLDQASRQNGWHIVEASAINDFGQIAAIATQGFGGPSRAVLLSQIPEPASVLLALSGFPLILLAKKRTNRRK